VEDERLERAKRAASRLLDAYLKATRSDVEVLRAFVKEVNECINDFEVIEPLGDVFLNFQLSYVEDWAKRYEALVQVLKESLSRAKTVEEVKRILEMAIEPSVRTLDEVSKRVLCPRCGRYVTPELYYTLHRDGICLEPLPFDYEEDC